MQQSVEYVVINDGQYQYPVRVSDLREGDTEASLSAMTDEQYAAWCQTVPADFDAVGDNVGSQACIDFCEALTASGSAVWNIA